jgi:transcriptional regulator with XRE-family HTH domain
VEARTTPAESPLRLARRHRNWTLDRVVSEIDAYLGGSGVTASLVSAWERGTRRTSPRYRAALCSIYGQPPEVLFAHQDKGRPPLTWWTPTKASSTRRTSSVDSSSSRRR